MTQEKVLIVDDVEMNRLVLEEIIKGMGCTPILAESGQQALELVKSERPQLVLTDISMPEMDGYELCKILKSKEKTKNIPVIFISAYDDPQDIVGGLSLGGTDYITKPFIPEVVQARVGVHLRLYEANRDLMEMNRRLQVSVSEQLKQMEMEKKNILYALANIAAQNSDYEQEHVERLRNNCRVLAQGMQLSPLFEDKISDTFIDTIELAAPLCDIGYIGVPRDILRKKESLTAEEQQIVETHTDIGARLLSDLYVSNDYNDFISTAIDIAHYHHENWDGSGYPDHLQKEEIPLAAQIVAVVERYCTLTGGGDRGREEALEVMKEEAGVKFNPDIFQICHKISRQLR
ncbi:MAG: response regulator [Candidatus Gastranaerophilales bacterium]|nr:response regulator [Candidatus Gastranaerophilales bacterium]